MTCGRLEARITLAAAVDLTLVVTAIGGPYTVTIAAGSYFPTALLSTIQTQLDAASGADGMFTVSMSKTDETGTGIVTISHATQTFTLAIPATFRSLLGFSADLTPAALTFSGTACMRGVWLPDCSIDSTYGREAGHTELDRSTTLTPTGAMSGLVYQSRRFHPEFRWSHVSRARAREAAETVVGQSFEAWFLDTHGGRYSYFATCPHVRVYDDSTNDTTPGTFALTIPTDTAAEKSAAPWHGLFAIVIGGYKVPA